MIGPALRDHGMRSWFHGSGPVAANITDELAGGRRMG
jgi:hypothetical protein